MARLLKDATPNQTNTQQAIFDLYDEEYTAGYEAFAHYTNDVNPDSYEYLQRAAETADCRKRR